MATDFTDNLGFILHDVSRMIRIRFDARARALGVTRAQWRVLFSLARIPGQSQSELAERLEVERITLCRMIDRLAEAGLVERRADPADRRVWRLHLQTRALAIVDQLARIAAELEAEILDHADDPAALIANLRQLRNGLREAGSQRKAA